MYVCAWYSKRGCLYAYNEGHARKLFRFFDLSFFTEGGRTRKMGRVRRERRGVWRQSVAGLSPTRYWMHTQKLESINKVVRWTHWKSINGVHLNKCSFLVLLPKRESHSCRSFERVFSLSPFEFIYSYISSTVRWASAWENKFSGRMNAERGLHPSIAMRM